MQGRCTKMVHVFDGSFLCEVFVVCLVVECVVCEVVVCVDLYIEKLVCNKKTPKKLTKVNFQFKTI